MSPDVPHSSDTPRQALYRQEALTALNDGYIGAALFNFPRTLSVPAVVLFLALVGMIAALWSAEFTHAVRVNGHCCSAPSAPSPSGATGGVLYIPVRLLQFVRLGDPVTVTLDTGARIKATILAANTGVMAQAAPARTGPADHSRHAVVEWRFHERAGALPPAGAGRNQAIVASVTIRAGFLQWAISLLSDNRKKT